MEKKECFGLGFDPDRAITEEEITKGKLVKMI
jgi:hypothetical protein